MSNISIARSIFLANVNKLQDGVYKEVNKDRPYKAFRQETIALIAAGIKGNKSTASTMFTTIKNASIKANPMLSDVLKRDAALGRK